MQCPTAARLDANLRRQLPPVLYQNYLMGDSKDLIFGTSLTDYAISRGLVIGPGIALGLADGDREPDGREHDKNFGPRNGLQWDDQVPHIVKICVHEIDNRGLMCEGIYRVSALLYLFFSTR